jgi:protease I
MRKQHDTRVAILVADGFEQIELEEPQEALAKAGAKPRIVSPETGQVAGFHHTEKGDSFPVDVPLSEADPADFDALVLPGGVHNPDSLRANPKALEFVRAFFDAEKPVACICHGAWTLIDAGVVRGRTMTSYHSIGTDVRNAGATWVDEEVVRDGNLITSRDPGDLPAFCDALVSAV